jgi:thiamine-phosphate pyrophosphorylase
MNSNRQFLIINKLNDEVKEKIKKFININIILYNFDDEVDGQLKIDNFNTVEAINYCKKNQLPFYITDNVKLALQTKANGIFLSAKNKKIIPKIQKLNFEIIGSAHNQIEYYFKKKQGCTLLMLSPIFFNKKYSENKILGPIKFNLISNSWNNNLCALGGISSKTLNKIKLTRVTSIAFISLILEPQIKKPAYFINRRAF